MEPSYSVLIFSKYSPNCKKLFDMVASSGIDFERTRLQLLCIDNEKVRKRIRDNEQIDVTSVPCILCIFSNGGVEKYDGGHAFAWIENLIARFAPPPPPITSRPPPPPQRSPRREEPQPEPEQEPEPEREPDREPDPEIESYREPEPRAPRPRSQPKARQPKQPKIKVPSRMKPIRRDEPDDTQATSITDIPLEDLESSTDRHKNIPPPRRIRQDEGQYIEDENLFSGEAPDIRRGSSTGVRSSATDRKNSPDPHGLRAKAEELARGRDDMESIWGAQNRRPMADRRP